MPERIAAQDAQMNTVEKLESKNPISSNTPRELWSHPTLDLFATPLEKYQPQSALLFSTPTTFGESFAEDDQPIPTSAQQLPDVNLWTLSLAVSALEVFAGRRNPAQLAMKCHRVIYNEILFAAGLAKEVGKVVKIIQDFPLDGVAESVLTVKYSKRMRAMVIRAEGINGRWLCTALELL